MAKRDDPFKYGLGTGGLGLQFDDIGTGNAFEDSTQTTGSTFGSPFGGLGTFGNGPFGSNFGASGLTSLGPQTDPPMARSSSGRMSSSPIGERPNLGTSPVRDTSAQSTQTFGSSPSFSTTGFGGNGSNQARQVRSASGGMGGFTPTPSSVGSRYVAATSSSPSSLSNIWETAPPVVSNGAPGSLGMPSFQSSSVSTSPNPKSNSASTTPSHFTPLFGGFPLGGFGEEPQQPGNQHSYGSGQQSGQSWSMNNMSKELDNISSSSMSGSNGSRNYAPTAVYDHANQYQHLTGNATTTTPQDKDEMFLMDFEAQLQQQQQQQQQQLGSSLPNSYRGGAVGGLSTSYASTSHTIDQVHTIGTSPGGGMVTTFAVGSQGSNGYPGSPPYGSLNGGQVDMSTYNTIISPNGNGSILQQQQQQQQQVPFGEHPLGEHPSRTLFVRNINSNVEDDELSGLFEQYGPIRSMYTQCKHRGFVMISYYDIRHAKNAMRYLQGKILRRRKLDIHYSIPKDNPSEKDQNQGTLVVFNLDPSTTNDELKNIFGSFGEIKEIRETPNKKHHKFIEFYDIRDADKAMKNLNKTEIKGKKIKIEPSRPGGARKNMIGGIGNQPGSSVDSNIGSYDRASASSSYEDLLIDPAYMNIGNNNNNSNSNVLSSSSSSSSSLHSQSLPFVPQHNHNMNNNYANNNNNNDYSGNMNNNNNNSNMMMMMNNNNNDIDNISNMDYHNNQLYNNSSSSLLLSGPYSPSNNSYPPPQQLQLPKYVPNNNPSSAFSPPNHQHNNNNQSSSYHYQSNSNHNIINNSYSTNGSGIRPASPISSSLSSRPRSRSITSPVPFQDESSSGGGGMSYASIVTKSPSASSISSVWGAGGGSNYDHHHHHHHHSSSTSSTPRAFSPTPIEQQQQQRKLSFSSAFNPVIMMNPNTYRDTISSASSSESSTPTRDKSPEPTRNSSSNSISSSSSAASRHRSQSIEDDKSRYVLNIDKVRAGDDIRTTLMIKNIPNKYNQKMLLSTVDDNHKGLYDFFYLPIDFKNKCNVGYAFINFISPSHIPSFYQEFNNKKWEKFNSEKVCEISYARIQGKNALIGHFQNSSLMVEDKKCRPMIFQTEGPNAGDPEPFPIGNSPRRRSYSNSSSNSKDDI